jgi:3-hydroxyisobutyrate dehydrogenase-like beta-hydroxyacid dehydrogenase
MPKQTIALLHPGEMGAALGACLVSRGHRVVWASEGRSASTRTRAADAGLEDLKSLARAVEASEIVFSVCPPHGALDLADEIAALEFDGLYVDANAIAPDTTREVGSIVEAAGARFVDGGIIGPPPVAAGLTRVYFSGAQAKQVAALFDGSHASGTALAGDVGAASALKVCYAAWNKGSIALFAAIRTLAQAEGVDKELLAEWNNGIPDLAKRSEVITVQARKAWRWIAEMEEIASSFEAANLPPGFHQAAAEIYRKLEGFKDAPKTPAMKDITAQLSKPAPD